MKHLRRILTFACTVLLATGFAELLQAQESARADAITAYNSARDLVDSGSFLDAVDLYTEAMEIAQSPECEDCADLVEQARNQIPRVYFERARTQFQVFQGQQSLENINLAIDYFQDAGDAAEEFGDDQVRDQARGAMPQLYYARSIRQYNNEDYAGAIESLNRAMELNEDYTLAYYQKAIVLNNSDGTLDEVLEWFDRAIEVGERTGQSDHVARSRSRAAQELVYQGVLRMEAGQRPMAIELLQRALEYNANYLDAHYRLAEVYNQRGNWQDAQTHAERALALETGGAAVRARHYFELGLALQGQGSSMRPRACEAFESAAVGEFRDPALHIMEFELECEGYASAGQ